jgi:hypothetical protein
MAGGTIDYVLNLNADASAATGTIGELKQGVGGIQSAIGGLAIAGIATGVLAAVDATATLQTQVGTTAELLDLSVEDTSRLTAALGLAGIEADEVATFALDIASGIEGSDVAMEAFGLEAGEALTPLEAITLAYDNWNLLTPTERIQTYGEEANRILGKLIEDGETFSGVMSDIPDAQVFDAEQVAAAEAYKDAMAEANAAYASIVVILSEQLIPLMTTAADAAGVVGEKIAEWSDDSENVDAWFGNLTGQIGQAGQAFLGMFDREKQQEIQDNLLGVQEEVKRVGYGLDDVADKDYEANIDVISNAEIESLFIDAVADKPRTAYIDVRPTGLRFAAGAIAGVANSTPQQTINFNYGRAITPAQFAAAGRDYQFSNGG